MTKRHHIVFYSGEGCCLCHQARAILHRLEGKFPTTVQEIDITTDASLYERYRNAVPVLIIDERFTLEAPIHEEELRAYLSAAPQGSDHRLKPDKTLPSEGT